MNVEKSKKKLNNAESVQENIIPDNLRKDNENDPIVVLQKNTNYLFN